MSVEGSIRGESEGEYRCCVGGTSEVGGDDRYVFSGNGLTGRKSGKERGR